MESEQSQRIFQQADALFRGGNPAEAAKLLQQLDRMHPNQLEILFPALLCLEKLGHKREAVQLAERLVRDFNDPRARKVRQRIAPPDAYAPLDISKADTVIVPAATGGVDLDANPLVGLLDDAAPRRAAPPPVPRRRAAAAGHREMMVLAGIAVAVLLLAGLILVLSARHSMASQVLSISIYCLITFMASVPAGWVALIVFNNLPNNDFVEDIKDIALYSVFCLLICLVPLIGMIAALVILNGHYRLSCGSLIGTVVVWHVVSALVGGVLYVLFILSVMMWGVLLY